MHGDVELPHMTLPTRTFFFLLGGTRRSVRVSERKGNASHIKLTCMIIRIPDVYPANIPVIFD